VRFITEADQLAHAAQLDIEAAKSEAHEAAHRGELAALDVAEEKERQARRRLAEARARIPRAECRHCGKEFDPEESVELVLSAIVRRKPGEIPAVETFERGHEMHLIYCLGCANESRLMMYLKKR
jgi:DNA repair exonuclease SbcCD ATPase subunit